MSLIKKSPKIYKLESVNIKETDGLLDLLPSTLQNLEAIAMCVRLNNPILLEGVVGSGKTCLVEHLAEITGRSIPPLLTKIHLGGQTDCRSLIGSYMCTINPGEFVWQAGLITKCVMEGHWLLLEDINMAPMEIISVLHPLLELRSLLVPGLGTVKAHENFQIFATIRTDTGLESDLGPITIIRNLFRRVSLQPLTAVELQKLVAVKFPKLSGLTEEIVRVYVIMSSGKHNLDGIRNNCITCTNDRMKRPSGRLVSVRDLFKWCSRIVHHVSDKEFRTKLYNDAFDCFCAAIPNENFLKLFANHVGSHLGLNSVKSSYYYSSHTPQISIANERFVVGERAELPVRTGASGGNKEAVFSHTRQSCWLLEQITVAVSHNEPVLLIGETGTGKTTAVQYLANKTGNKLRVLNMNQQSDSGDLMGGFRPVEISSIVKPLLPRFKKLLEKTNITKKNKRIISSLANLRKRGEWSKVLCLMKKWIKVALNTIKIKRKILNRFKALLHDVKKSSLKIKKVKSTFAFAFIEGTLIKAIKEGDWVLLDEINLSSVETLECLSGLLENVEGSVTLYDNGEYLPIKRESNFRLFACMNPATDVGKKNLPAGLRNRFTEFFISELQRSDLLHLVADYLKDLSVDKHLVKGIVDFYFKIKSLSKHELADGTGHKPYFSLRTLCRALSAAQKNPFFVHKRSLYETFCMSFLTQLDRKSHPKMVCEIAKFVWSQNKELKSINEKLPCPGNAEDYIQICNYWIRRGDLQPNRQVKYIITPSVQRNLQDLVRIVSLGGYPVLLQGDTSVGKTSLILYLAELTGNKCLRINNHQHTDIQEYIGSYGPDVSGKFVFKEGALVSAIKMGHWVILDELNLAPTDVLEALNRLLDDNRELIIPEIGKTIKAHDRFRIFATQNPPHQYGGRQVLSRAFRNRFLELHFDLIPTIELEEILHLRSEISLVQCKQMVGVYEQLQKMRRETNHLQGNQSFITLRDLFRWAERYRLTSATSDNESLAHEGYLILGSRGRLAAEEEAVRNVLETIILNGQKIIIENLFTLNINTSPVTRDHLKMLSSIKGFEHIVWTFNMRRLFVLVSKAMAVSEPVLLVGETGCGKTSLCQMMATMMAKNLRTINCHMHSEGADFLGAVRPVRGKKFARTKKLFEWVDGPLVLSMKEGGIFLADEISLADDSVLERLNSLLETGRALTLTEKGSDNAEIIVAHEDFRIVGTMNPGGDFGKKELSIALRNRFTEIWCPKINAFSETKDLIEIIEHNVAEGIVLTDKYGDSGIGRAMVSFLQYILTSEIGKKYSWTIRDLLSWVTFINNVTKKSNVEVSFAYFHGACLMLLDGLGSGTTGSAILDCKKLKIECLTFLGSQIYSATGKELDKVNFLNEGSLIQKSKSHYGIEPFTIKVKLTSSSDTVFAFEAPKTRTNLLHLLRGLQLSRPILLEGSPGVGKTSLVIALATVTGHNIIRINLSEQTDVSDLFGADFPVEGEESSRFAWRDGPLLQALKNGSWVVFDELNLASQPVLEGLNACFDHRGEIFVPELNRTFKVKQSKTNIFACQNPQCEGGARKGLPKSFLNRFTQVHLETLCAGDLQFILKSLYSDIPEEILDKMVTFNEALIQDMRESHWGMSGGPWEFNLRDLFRWCDIMKLKGLNPGEYVGLIYANRFRRAEDKLKVKNIYCSVFGDTFPFYERSGKFYLSSTKVQFGRAVISRVINEDQEESLANKNLYILNNQTPTLEALVECVNMKWMSILVGASDDGKTSMVHALAKLVGQKLVTFPVNPEMDVTELLGGFEQVHHLEGKTGRAFEWVDSILVKAVKNGDWLLIDRVNLCSPSVLDRLNGLLEVGGVLTISERGVVDGSVPTIVPHPNFRLFLLMDPKHGELSRAMRNRGVEISLTSPMNNVLDFQALMCSGNLMNFSLQNTLINAHQMIFDRETAFKKPSLSALVQASSLSVQLMKYGYSQNNALEVAIQQSYNDNPLGRDIKTLTIPHRAAVGYNMAPILLPIDSLIRNRETVVVRQYHAMLKLICHDVPYKGPGLPLALRKYPRNTLTTSKLLPIVVVLLSSITISQWNILRTLCNIERFPMSKTVSVLIDKMSEYKGSMSSNSEVSLDTRFHSEHVSALELSPTVTSSANKSLLALWHAATEVWKILEDHHCDDKSAISLARAWRNKSINLPHKQLKALKYLIPFKAGFRNLFINLTETNLLDITNEMYFSFITALGWIQQFESFCNDAPPKKPQLFLPKLSFIWKNIFSNLIHMTPSDCQSVLLAPLEMNIKKLQTDFMSDHNPFVDMAVFIRETVPTQLPFYRKCDYEVIKRLYKLCTITPVIDCHSSNALLASKSGTKIKENILSIASALSANNLTIANNLSIEGGADIRSQTKLDQYLNDELNKLASVLSAEQNSIDTHDFDVIIQMWPIYDHFVSTLLQANIHGKGCSSPNQALMKASHIPANLLWINDTRSRPQFLFCYLFKMASCSLMKNSHWMTYASSGHDVKNSNQGNIMCFDSGSCSQIYLFISSCTTGKDMDKISILNHREHVKRTKEIQSMLCYNWDYFSNKKNSSVNVYFEHVKASTVGFMNAIIQSEDGSASSPEDNDMLKVIRKASIVVKNCITKLPESYNSVNLLFSELIRVAENIALSEDTINMARFGILSGALQSWLLSKVEYIIPAIKRSILLEHFQAEKEQIEQVLEVFRLIDLLRYNQQTGDSHPHRSVWQQRHSTVIKDMITQQQKISYHPQPATVYYDFITAMRKFMETYFYPDKILDIIDRTQRCGDTTVAKDFINYLDRCENFVNSIISSHSQYRDIFASILEGICVALEGFRILVSNVQRLALQEAVSTDVDSFISGMLCFPVNRPCIMANNLDHSLDLQKNAEKFFSYINTSQSSHNSMLLLTVLYDVYNSILCQGLITSKSFEVFNDVLVKINNSYCPIGRAAIEARERHFYFPSYKNEFDVEYSSSQERKSPSKLNENHLQEVIWVHKIVMNLANEKPHLTLLPFTPSLLRMQQMQILFTQLGPFGSDCCDINALSGVLFRNHITMDMLQSRLLKLTLSTKPYNFYKDPNQKAALEIVDVLKETEKCLRKFKLASGISKVLNVFRKVKLSVTSPLIEIIYSLKSIFKACQEWSLSHEIKSKNNINCNNLLLHIDQIKEQIKYLRTKEIKSWNCSLDIISHEISTMANEHWLQLFNIIHSSDDIVKLINNLKSFIESSSVGEYKIRLDYTLAFYNHVLYEGEFESDEMKTERAAVLWNTYSYYSQFLPSIKRDLIHSKKGIGKKLDMYISGLNLNEINIDHLDNHIDNSQRVVYSLMQEWKTALLQKHVFDSDTNLTSYLRDLNIARPNTGKVSGIEELQLEVKTIEVPTNVPSKLAMLIPMCEQYIKATIENLPYYKQRDAFNELSVQALISCKNHKIACHRANMAAAINKENSKELFKQVIADRKKSMNKILSLINFKSVPHIIAKTLDMFGNKKTVGSILEKFWLQTGIKISGYENSVLFAHIDKEHKIYEEIYFRNIARLFDFCEALNVPHATLEKRLLSKMEANAYTASALVHHLHLKLSTYSTNLSECRLMYLGMRKSLGGVFLEANSEFSDWWLILSSHLASLQLAISEAREWVNILTCAEGEPVMKFNEMDSFAIEYVSSQHQVLLKIAETVKNLQEQLNSSSLNKGNILIVNSHDMTTLEVIYKEVSLIAESILGINLESNDKLFPQLNKWAQSFEGCHCKFLNWHSSLDYIANSDTDMALVVDEDRFKNIFIAVQKLYKKHCQLKKFNVTIDNFPSLIDSFVLFLEDIHALNVTKVTATFETTVLKLQKNATMQELGIVELFMPVFDKYLLMCEMLLLTFSQNISALFKLHSILLEMYTNLVRKGWDTPESGNQSGAAGRGGHFNKSTEDGNTQSSDPQIQDPEKNDSGDENHNGNESGVKNPDKNDSGDEKDEIKSGYKNPHENESCDKNDDESRVKTPAENESGDKNDDESRAKNPAENECGDKNDDGSRAKNPDDNEAGDKNPNENESGDNNPIENKSGDKMDENKSGDTKPCENISGHNAEDHHNRSEVEAAHNSHMPEELDDELWDLQDKIPSHIKNESTKINTDNGDHFPSGNDENRQKMEDLEVMAEDLRIRNENNDDEEKTYGDDYKDNFFDNDNDVSSNFNIDLCAQFKDAADDEGDFDMEPYVEDKPLFPETKRMDVIPSESEVPIDNELGDIPVDSRNPVGDEESNSYSNTYEEYRKAADFEKPNDSGDTTAEPAEDGGTEASCSNQMKGPLNEQIGIEEFDEIQNEYGAIGEKTNDESGTGQSDAKTESGAHAGKSSSLSHETNQPINSNKNEEDGGAKKRSSDEADFGLLLDSKPLKTARLEDISKDDADTDFSKMEVDGEFVAEATVERPSINEFATNIRDEDSTTPIEDHDCIQPQMCEQGDMIVGVQEWSNTGERISSLALQLCEQLRLVLEPTEASKLKGDFRTGKRLNMRKIIPYIASDFRKDKIWMRRVQPNKRTYQILLAVDDSESMAEIKADSMARDGVAMVAKALTILEAGSVGIVSFGKETKLLHPMNMPFSDEAGESVFSNLKFNQQESNFAEMLNNCGKMLSDARGGGGGPNSNIEQLLLILSDGQTQANSDAVRRAVRSIRDKRVIVIFLVLDAPGEKYSFRDLCLYDSKEKKVKPFIDSFPFPFYLIVRSMTALPSDLSTAIREWFEFICNV